MNDCLIEGVVGEYLLTVDRRYDTKYLEYIPELLNAEDNDFRMLVVGQSDCGGQKLSESGSHVEYVYHNDVLSQE